jgi:hypothetical protein
MDYATVDLIEYFPLPLASLGNFILDENNASGLSQQLQQLISQGESAAAKLATDTRAVVASGTAVGVVHYFLKLTHLRRSKKSC